MKGTPTKPLVAVTVTMGANAEVVDTFIFTATGDYEVIGVSEVHDVIGSDVGAVTLDVKKCASGTTIASGTSVLASTFSLKSTADTPVRKTVADGGISSAQATRIVKDGESLAIDITGTTTAVAGVAVTVWLKPLSRPTF